jgi:hypothetical protein
MKRSTAIAIGVGAGLIVGAAIGGTAYAVYKGAKAILKHETYSVSLNTGSVPTGSKASVMHYPELKMSVIKVSKCKFTVPDAGAALSTDAFLADLVSDVSAGTTYKMPSGVFKSTTLAAGEYVVAKVFRDSTTGAGGVMFSLATGPDNEKQGLPLHAGAWEVNLPIIITWESK